MSHRTLDISTVPQDSMGTLVLRIYHRTERPDTGFQAPKPEPDPKLSLTCASCPHDPGEEPEFRSLIAHLEDIHLTVALKTNNTVSIQRWESSETTVSPPPNRKRGKLVSQDHPNLNKFRLELNLMNATFIFCRNNSKLRLMEDPPCRINE